MPGVALKGAHLSFQQERLWVFQQGNTAYRSQCVIAMHGKLNFPAFEQALQQMVEQHTIFQTVFHTLPGMDMPIQVIGRVIEICCPLIDLQGVDAATQHAQLELMQSALQSQAFDLQHGPLFYPVVWRLAAENALLHISLPALYADTSTLPLLIAELAKRYAANLSGQELLEEPLQYAAVSAWQKQQIVEESEAAKRSRKFWERIHWNQVTQMQHSLEQIGLVVRERASARTSPFSPLVLSVPVDDVLSTRIAELAARYTVTVPVVLLACWQVILWRLTSMAQLVIGVACNGRNYEELAEALGLYTRFVPFDTALEASWSFSRLLAFVEALLETTEKHQLGFSWPSALPQEDKFAEASFFPLVFEQDQWPASFEAGGLQLQLEQRICCTEPFILKLAALQIGERLRIELHYDAQCVSKEWVVRLSTMMRALLEQVSVQPQTPVGALTLLTASERLHLLRNGSGPQRDWPEQGFCQLFEEQARLRPTALAALSQQEELSYQQLNARANQLAAVLRRRGVGPNVVVGLCLPRDASMLVGLLGVLKAGGAYLPLDVNSPPARLQYQLQGSQACLLLTREVLRASLPAWSGPTISLEELTEELAQASTDNAPSVAEAADLAYVMYTSGSTGTPKGVLISRGSMMNYTYALCERLDGQPGWQYATVSTLAADLGNTMLFCALASGGCVQVLSYEQVTSGQAMAQWARQHPIDVLKIVPSHLAALLEEESAGLLLPRRVLVLGGEALSPRLLRRLAEVGASCEVYNHYGPTETTIGVLVHALGVPREQLEQHEEESIALGRPIANTRVYVLDERMQLVPPGVRGELYIGGAALAWGYSGQGEQTAQRFVPDPFNAEPGARLYRTGDLVRWSEGGQLSFEGRGDGQVKLRGYRIEVGEIEAVLRQHSQVRDCAVVLQKDLRGDSCLVSYIVPTKVPLLTDINLRGFLRERLPDYMLPSNFIYMKVLPLTANGKVDRQRLSAMRAEENQGSPGMDSSGRTRTLIQPRDVIEMQLLQIWEEVLQVEPLSVLDNFFDAGGHSLLAVRLMSRITECFGCSLDVATLFQRPTVAELAMLLRQQSIPEESSLLVAIQPQGSRLPLFCVHPAGGTAFCYVNLARHLGPEQPFYGIHAPYGDKAGNQWKTAEEMAAHYIAEIQTVQPEGPYLLGGWSLGGVIAFEMAQQLLRKGHEVVLLALIDSNLADPQVREETLAEDADLSDERVVRELISTFELVVPDDFDQRTIESRLEYAVEQAKNRREIPMDTNPELVYRFARTKINNKHVAHAYAPAEYTKKIEYFSVGTSTKSDRASGMVEGIMETDASHDRLQYWHALAKGGFEVHDIPGSHRDILEEPYVQVLARSLQQCIDRIYSDQA
jgi:amino acid adenylation domain-containing protein